jgi:hypothetical protein
MGVYVGYVEKVPYENNKFFYNIKPFAEMCNGQILELTNSERAALLPKSREQSVMLYYEFKDNDAKETLEALFAEESLATLDKGKHKNNNKMDCQPYRKRRPATQKGGVFA